MTESELALLIGEAINTDSNVHFSRVDTVGQTTYAYVDGHVDLSRIARKILAEGGGSDG